MLKNVQGTSTILPFYWILTIYGLQYATYTDAFTVLVGVEEENFILHWSIAVAHSKFFRAACNGQFKEAQEKVIRLPDIKPSIFRAYLQWIYSGHVVVLTAAGLSADHKGIDSRVELVKLYALADVLADTPLRNRIIDEIRASLVEHQMGFGVRAICFAYENAPARCTLHRLIVDHNVHNSKTYTTWFEDYRTKLPSEFFTDLAIGISKTGWERPPHPRDAARCTYHEHDDECPKCVD
ncbi:hypothetical protein LTR56_001285 [Elasticomyces elasticus]|nr:hypothetical protein LTR56_001285 [Elasticomyces elasticus]KAK3667466.1 hypothetical protein LTR22_001644 [Elasticomyces elasticus]KAK4907520.1 hypothetical protein LTR49_023461 [Elasticomyces elasticus]KAK5760465.1 hypothetical protein LTS12_009338 [Elasticomyces elasticus]